LEHLNSITRESKSKQNSIFAVIFQYVQGDRLADHTAVAKIDKLVVSGKFSAEFTAGAMPCSLGNALFISRSGYDAKSAQRR
jgi:hypothetical protein